MAIVTTGGLVDIPPASTTLPPAQWAIAAGTSDVITAAYAIPNTSLPDGLLLAFRALANNTTTAPTFSPDGLPAGVLVHYGTSLVANNIRAGGEYTVRYQKVGNAWVLLDISV